MNSCRIIRLQAGLVHERYWSSNILRLGGSYTYSHARSGLMFDQGSLSSFNAGATLILDYDWMLGVSGTWNGKSGVAHPRMLRLRTHMARRRASTITTVDGRPVGTNGQPRLGTLCSLEMIDCAPSRWVCPIDSRPSCACTALSIRLISMRRAAHSVPIDTTV